MIREGTGGTTAVRTNPHLASTVPRIGIASERPREGESLSLCPTGQSSPPVDCGAFPAASILALGDERGLR